jgi:hypothetical protein
VHEEDEEKNTSSSSDLEISRISRRGRLALENEL